MDADEPRLEELSISIANTGLSWGTPGVGGKKTAEKTQSQMQGRMTVTGR
jgi:hypothetical protein